MSSHPSPFHRQRQSNKTLDPTGQTAKFLYTILKQLDLKNIDWNEVASSLDITNGHAARMRWSRFRAQIEGIDNSYSRKGGRKKEGEKKRKKDGKDGDQGTKGAWGQETSEMKKPKLEAGIGYEMDGWLGGRHENNGQVSTSFKKEATERVSVIDGINVHHPAMTTISVPQSNAANISSSRRATGMGVHLSGGIHPSYDDKPMFDQKAQQQLGASSGSHIPYRWPQPYHNMGYAQHPYRSYTTPTSGSPTPHHYPSQHMYANAYPNQAQQRYGYGQPMMLGQFHHQQQQQQPYMYAHANSQITDNVSVARGPSNMSIDPQIQLQTNLPMSCSSTNDKTATNIDPAQTKVQPSSSISAHSTVQIQEQTCNLSSQTSYPWPYNETSLSQLVSQLNDPIELVTSINEQQTASEVSNKDNQQGASNSSFGVTAANSTQHNYSNSSDLGPATIFQSEAAPDFGGEAKSKETTELVTTGEMASGFEQPHDYPDMTTGIKVEPSA